MCFMIYLFRLHLQKKATNCFILINAYGASCTAKLQKLSFIIFNTVLNRRNKILHAFWFYFQISRFDVLMNANKKKKMKNNH